MKLLLPDSAVPDGPLAVADTDPEPWSGTKEPPLSMAVHRLPEPLADRVIVRPPTWTRKVTLLTLPVVPVAIVADVEWPQPERLSIVDGDTDGVNTAGRGGRVVVVVVVVVVGVLAHAGPIRRAAPAKTAAAAAPAAATAAPRRECKWPISDIVAQRG